MLKFGHYRCLLLISIVLTALMSACAGPLQPIKAIDSSSDDSLVTPRGAFVDALMVAVTQRDYAEMQGVMGNSFGLTQVGAAAVERPPAIAIMTLRDRYFGVGSALTFPTDTDLDVLLADLDLDTLWDQPLELADTLYVTGLGMHQRDEALLLIARAADESFYWRGIVVAPGGFGTRSATTNAITLSALAQETTTDLSSPVTTNDALAAISLSAVLVPIPAAKAEVLPAAPVQIDLPQERPDARLRGVLQAAQSRLYILHGAEGQSVTVAVASNSGLVNFSITGIDDGKPYKRLVDEARSWQDTLPMTQDYLITVASTVALPFELTITTDPTALSAATTASTTPATTATP